jgi:hypothetical protein
MRHPVICLALFCAACGVARQPDSIRTVAAFEVPLPAATDKAEFVRLLRSVAQAHGYHVDAASPTALRQMSDVSPITLNAAVWRGNDEEVVASAMDFQDHIGRVWLTFDRGQDPQSFSQFRSDLMPQVQKRWPNTASLPIMPTGAIPLADDLVRTPSGYAVRPSGRLKYQVQSQ